GLLCLVVVTGCGGKDQQIAVDAAKHYAAAFGAIEVPAWEHKGFKSAVESENKAAAAAALEKVKKAVAKAKAEMSELPSHPWKSAQECDAACKSLLEVEETIMIPEMEKIVKVLEAGKVGDEGRKQIAAAFAKINESMLKKIDDATEASHRL